jgi:hypothetical protein
MNAQTHPFFWGGAENFSDVKPSMRCVSEKVITASITVVIMLILEGCMESYIYCFL